MTVILDPAPVAGSGLQKGRGGFLRNSADVPYVTDPDGGLVKSGQRQGEIKRLPYGSPSSFGEQIANLYSVTKWGERGVIVGMLYDIGLTPKDVDDILIGDRDSKEWKSLVDGYVVKAKNVAGLDLDKDRGTYMHRVVLEDRSNPAEADALGIPLAVQYDLLGAFDLMRYDYGLELIVIEAACVNDPLRLAGTTDAHVRLTRDLRLIGPGGEIVELAAGTVLVLDLKCGRLRLDRQGRIEYWRDYPIQIAAYAGSVPYDTETETRGEWGYEIDQRWALLAHLNTREAIAGEPAACTLVLVDIAAGRAACDVVVAAKNWEKRTDVMTVQPPQIASGGVTPSASSDAEPQAGVGRSVSPASACPPEQENPWPTTTTSPRVTSTTPPTTTSPEPSTATSTATSRTSATPSSGSATPSTPSSSSTRADVLADLGYTAEHGHILDEGDPVTPADFAVLEAAFNKVDANGQAWFKRLVKESAQASVPFGAHDTKTVRRYELYRGLIALAADGNFARDEVVRGLVSTVLDTEAALFPTLTVGHVVGVMTADEAKRFALLCDELVAT